MPQVLDAIDVRSFTALQPGTIAVFQWLNLWQRHQPSQVWGPKFEPSCVGFCSSRCGPNGQQMCNGNGRAKLDVVQHEACLLVSLKM